MPDLDQQEIDDMYKKGTFLKQIDEIKKLTQENQDKENVNNNQIVS